MSHPETRHHYHEDVRTYLRLLRRLHESDAFGRAAIYPAIGLDCFIAHYSPLIGLNHWPYDIHTIMQHLADIVPSDSLSPLVISVEQNLVYESRIDITRLQLVAATLGPYRAISPKSLILKGLFESTFLREWEPDSERYYDVPRNRAQVRARHWLTEVLNLFSSGDRVVLFDPLMLDLVVAEPRLREIHLPFTSLEPDPVVVYRAGVPIIYLSRWARLFGYV